MIPDDQRRVMTRCPECRSTELVEQEIIAEYREFFPHHVFWVCVGCNAWGIHDRQQTWKSLRLAAVAYFAFVLVASGAVGAFWPILAPGGQLLLVLWTSIVCGLVIGFLGTMAWLRSLRPWLIYQGWR